MDKNNALSDIKKDLTVVMPALNEEKNILSAVNSTLEAFKSFDIDGEIIVINDGSTDRTEKIVKEIISNEGRIRMITHQSPQGIGASFWDGADKAYGDAVVMLPGDGENDPRETFRYYKLLEDVDIVIPFLYNEGSRPLSRKALSFIYRFIINATFMVNFNYTNGTVLYRRSILQDLPYRNRGFFFQTDILIRTVKRGYLFAEVPYKIGSRKHGASKAVSFPSFLKVVRGYARLVRDYYFTKNSKSDPLFSEGSRTDLRRNDKE